MEWRRGRERKRERERERERERKREREDSNFFEYYSQEKEELESYLPSDTLDRLCGS